MELSQFTLDSYIHSPESVEGLIPDNDGFVALSAGRVNLSQRLENVWTITDQIACGLAFIHSFKLVHRDLKPRNILYCASQNAWKIADFGSAADATSKHAQFTEFSRGTASYRAPELLGEYPVFTNKVDIWALGCIIYELVSQERAFHDDYAVRQYARGRGRFIGIDIPFQC